MMQLKQGSECKPGLLAAAERLASDCSEDDEEAAAPVRQAVSQFFQVPLLVLCLIFATLWQQDCCWFTRPAWLMGP